MLTASAGSDLLSPASWTKSPQPVFQSSPADQIYGTGHNGFFKSPDGTEDWFIYQASTTPTDCCGSNRSAKTQKINRRADDTPDFRKFAPLCQNFQRPS